jgi:hypothetical protein
MTQLVIFMRKLGFRGVTCCGAIVDDVLPVVRGRHASSWKGRNKQF